MTRSLGVRGGSGLAIGASVTGGTSKSVLYVGPTGLLAQDNAAFFYDQNNDALAARYLVDPTVASPPYPSINIGNFTGVFPAINPGSTDGSGNFTEGIALMSGGLYIIGNTVFNQPVLYVIGGGSSAQYGIADNTGVACIIGAPLQLGFPDPSDTLDFPNFQPSGTEHLILSGPADNASTGLSRGGWIEWKRGIEGADTDVVVGTTFANGLGRIVFSPGAQGSVNDLGVADIDPTVGRVTCTWTKTSGTKRLGTQFDKTNTTLSDVTGLSVTVIAGKTYGFRARLFVDANVTGGSKYAIAGTATATSIKYNINAISNTTNLFVINSRQTALAGAGAGQAGATSLFVELTGTIVVNAAGTLLPQFAQNAATGTSSILTDSDFNVWEI